MKMQYRAYEQYCCVLKRNIVLEETTYENGTKRTICTNYLNCCNCGGCKNRILKETISRSLTEV